MNTPVRIIHAGIFINQVTNEYIHCGCGIGNKKRPERVHQGRCDGKNRRSGAKGCRIDQRYQQQRVSLPLVMRLIVMLYAYTILQEYARFE